MIAAIDTSEINAWLNVGTIIGLIIVGVMNKLDARKAVKAATSASKISIETHTLVNSNFGVQLRKAMLQSRRIADMTTDPTAKAEAIKAADDDEDLYKRHLARQALVDAANALLDQKAQKALKSEQQ